MKNRIKFIAIFTIAFVMSLHFFKGESPLKLNDLSLKNIDALALEIGFPNSNCLMTCCESTQSECIAAISAECTDWTIYWMPC